VKINLPAPQVPNADPKTLQILEEDLTVPQQVTAYQGGATGGKTKTAAPQLQPRAAALAQHEVNPHQSYCPSRGAGSNPPPRPRSRPRHSSVRQGTRLLSDGFCRRRNTEPSLSITPQALFWSPQGPRSDRCQSHHCCCRLEQFRTRSQTLRSLGSGRRTPPQHPPPHPTLPNPNINLLTGNALKKRHLPESRRMPRK